MGISEFSARGKTFMIAKRVQRWAGVLSVFKPEFWLKIKNYICKKEEEIITEPIGNISVISESSSHSDMSISSG